MELTADQRRLQESAIEFARQALSYDVIAADAAEEFNGPGEGPAPQAKPAGAGSPTAGK